MWNWIAGIVWDTLSSGNSNGDLYQDQLEREAADWIQLAVKAAGISDLPQYLQEAFSTKMMDIIVGDNGTLEKEDFNDKTRDTLSDYVENVYGQLWNKNAEEVRQSNNLLSGREILNSIVDQIYGEGFSKAYTWHQSDEEVQAIATTYENLLRMGFSNADIKKVSEENGAKIWGAGGKQFSFFNNMTEKQLRSSQRLIQEYGYSLETFYDNLNDPDAADKFLSFLDNFDKTASRIGHGSDIDALFSQYWGLKRISLLASNNLEGATDEDWATISATPWLGSYVQKPSEMKKETAKTIEAINQFIDQYF